MGYKFLLVGDPKRLWREKLQEAVAPLGELRALTESEATAQVFDANYDVVIVDATAVEQLEEMVAQYSSQLNPPYIIVVTDDPTPDLALGVFRAGATDCILKPRKKDELETFFTELLAYSPATLSAQII
jgi:DNA-binding NarL/FixJ family response regulator